MISGRVCVRLEVEKVVRHKVDAVDLKDEFTPVVGKNSVGQRMRGERWVSWAGVGIDNGRLSGAGADDRVASRFEDAAVRRVG
jgi:hypothetical protein